MKPGCRSGGGRVALFGQRVGKALGRLAGLNLHLVAGQRMQVVAYGNRIELIPEKEIADMRGFLKGIDTAVEREPDRL